MVMEQCYGGGFKDEFIDYPVSISPGNGASQDRTLITASMWNEPSWANGFSNAWTTAVAGHDRWVRFWSRIGTNQQMYTPPSSLPRLTHRSANLSK